MSAKHDATPVEPDAVDEKKVGRESSVSPINILCTFLEVLNVGGVGGVGK